MYESKGSGDAYASTVLIVMLGIGFLLAILFYFFSDSLVRLFAPGIPNKEMAINFTKVMSVGVFFSFYLYVVPEYLRARGDYISQQFSGLILNILIIISIYVSYIFKSIYLAYGFVLVFRSIYALLISKKHGFTHCRFDINMLPDVFSMLKLTPVMIIAISSMQINS
jgi:putative peptidoglycan lipid II flippase